ncbi:MAG: NAD(P)H-dependent oxidoreductase [Actinomycetota bacterium]|nr:NAD(P)H-dependent oxidoreductase [Actinomycetota bacterium]
MPTLTVVVGSTRPGRAGLPITASFAKRAKAHGGFDVDIADLAEIGLPLFDEPNHPRLGQYIHEHTKNWSTRIQLADAVVFVTPEYNFGYPATVKNAIDYLHREWHHKPVGFVSYGGVAAGTRAVQQLKQVLTTVRMVPVVDSVSIPFHSQFIGEDGVVQPNAIMETSAEAMLDELLRMHDALHLLRAAAEQAA